MTSNNSTDQIHGRGVVGKHPLLTPEEPIFMVSSLFCSKL